MTNLIYPFIAADTNALCVTFVPKDDPFAVGFSYSRLGARSPDRLLPQFYGLYCPWLIQEVFRKTNLPQKKTKKEIQRITIVLHSSL